MAEPMRNMSAEQLILLLEKAEELGISSREILRDARYSFTLDDLHGRRVRHVTAVDFSRICQSYMARIRGRGWQGRGRLLSREDLNLMCHALVTSLTLGEAVERQARMYELLERRHGWIALTESDGVASIQLQVGPAEKCWERFFALAGCVGFARLLEWMIGGDMVATIMVKEPENRELQLIASMFSAPILFGQAFDGLTFPSDRLDRPVVRNGLEMREFLKVHPFDIYAEQQPRVSLSVQVAAAYRGAIMGGKPVPDVVALARNFGMSAATIRRHLDQEGSTVRVIKDSVRHRIALELLENDFLHVEQIATMLGFSCANAFARAFFEWQGDRPSAYRRRLKDRGRPADGMSYACATGLSSGRVRATAH